MLTILVRAQIIGCKRKGEPAIPKRERRQNLLPGLDDLRPDPIAADYRDFVTAFRHISCPACDISLTVAVQEGFGKPSGNCMEFIPWPEKTPLATA